MIQHYLYNIYIHIFIYIYVYRNQSVLFSLFSTLEDFLDTTKKVSTLCTMGNDGGYRNFPHNLHIKNRQNGLSG